MVRRGHDDGVDCLVIENTTKVLVALGPLVGHLEGAVQVKLVRVRNGNHVHLIAPDEVLQVVAALVTGADQPDADAVVRAQNISTRNAAGQRQRNCGAGRRLGERSPTQSVVHRHSSSHKFGSHPSGH